MIWLRPMWPALDRELWVRARGGNGKWGWDNPAVHWRERTVKKNEDGYGRYRACQEFCVRV
jgi:hypothetical protein